MSFARYSRTISRYLYLFARAPSLKIYRYIAPNQSALGFTRPVPAPEQHDLLREHTGIVSRISCKCEAGDRKSQNNTLCRERRAKLGSRNMVQVLILPQVGDNNDVFVILEVSCIGACRPAGKL